MSLCALCSTQSLLCQSLLWTALGLLHCLIHDTSQLPRVSGVLQTLQ